ncbi:3-hydroxy-3-methylglutaryl-CoA reductase [Patescibacteria group bacterium]|nr:3-hydroxy-3-methylglutaryl-CoA reductase [Patescibacteria group bacterium]
MNLRNLPEDLDSAKRCEARRKLIEKTFGVDLSALQIDPTKLGTAEEKNCEQMFGHVPIPVGLAGPLKIHFSSDETSDVYLPLATTEAALVASVNRGCKALSTSGRVKTKSIYHGISRSIAFGFPELDLRGNQEASLLSQIRNRKDDWIAVGEQTSRHLKIIDWLIDARDNHVFLTIYADTDEAMGMNMVTIAAQAIGEWVEENLKRHQPIFLTVAGNVDSDKKPSQRTHDKGRGYEVTAEIILPTQVIEEVLKTTPEKLLRTAHAKLDIGSRVAGAIGSNLQAANVIAALYLATGQDAAHVVEGSLADTTVTCASSCPTRVLRVDMRKDAHVTISVRCPAILVGIRGGGTGLPAQSQCLELLQNPSPKEFAEIIAAAVLAGEISLLAAQTTHTLAKSHTLLAR